MRIKKDWHYRKFSERKKHRRRIPFWGRRVEWKRYLKRRSNKLIRRYRDTLANGRSCFRVFDYAYELY